MIGVKTVGLKDARGFLRDLSKQMPYATMLALNETSKDIKQAETKEMHRVFDKPTPFTLRSLRIDYAKKNKLASRVWFKDTGFTGNVVTNYMTTQIEGGPRRAKASERAMRRRGLISGDEFLVPSRTAPLDRYGNIRGGLMQRIMANIGAFDDPSQNTPVHWTRKRGRKREYVFGKVGTTRGVYQIQGDRWKLIFIVVQGAPRYKRRLDFYGIADNTHRERFDRHLDLAWDKALRTAR